MRGKYHIAIKTLCTLVFVLCSLGHGRGRHTGKRPQPGTVSTIMVIHIMCLLNINTNALSPVSLYVH